MKRLSKSATIAVAGGLLAAGALTAPASAHNAPVQVSENVTVETHTRGDGTQPPAALGDPTEWGVVTLTEPTGDFTAQTVLNIGGGKWSYGKELTTSGQYCYSNYYHPSVVHGSTVILVNPVKAVAGPGKWSYANSTGGAMHTCQTFYAKY